MVDLLVYCLWPGVSEVVRGKSSESCRDFHADFSWKPFRDG